MIENLKVVLEGKSTEIKNKQFLSTKDYISPFIERMKPFTNTFRCDVKLADQVSITDNVKDVVYNRVHIQAIFPEDSDGNKQIVGMIYGLDAKVPVAKFYIANTTGNNNLIAFNENCIVYQEIEDATPLDYSSLLPLLSVTNINKAMLDNMKNVNYSINQIPEMVGNWIDFTITNSYPTIAGKVSLSNTVPIKAYKLLFKDKDSDHYIGENTITLYKIYMAFLQVITDEKDILNEFEKVILVKKMLGL